MLFLKRCLLPFCVLFYCLPVSAGQLTLVKDGQPVSGIIIDEPTPLTLQAAQELQHHLYLASGAQIPIIHSPGQVDLPPNHVRIVIGNGPLSQAAGANSKRLPVDTWIVKTHDNQLFFNGHDTPIGFNAEQSGEWNAATLWAVNYFLDTQLGVRWLWPGVVGTYVPRRRTIVVPELHVTQRPALEKRILRLYRRTNDKKLHLFDAQSYQRMREEAYQWLRRFQMGDRSQAKFGHSFMHWWGKYHKEQPNFFAVPPPGDKYKMPWPRAQRVKLNLSNEAVDDAIISEWKNAGAPDYWNVSPNDGTGYDTRPETLAMDLPRETDLEAIWRGNTDLTVRYVRFWNRLIAKMRRINPNIKLGTYAYSAYYNPPPSGVELDSAVLLQIVPDYRAFREWHEWQRNGSKIMLRPNWWFTGATAPVIPLREQFDFFHYALRHNMLGFDFDQLHGHWAMQGIMYYVIARASVRPELKLEEIIDEYCSAFGEAAPQIRAYIKYWEDFTQKAGYPAVGFPTAGPHVKDGLYMQAVRKHKLLPESLGTSFPIIPHLYTDEVLGKAGAILDQAGQATAEQAVHQRINFLKAGLEHFKLNRDVLALGYKLGKAIQQQGNTVAWVNELDPNASQADLQKYSQLAGQLKTLRTELSLQHVTWGENAYTVEHKYKIPTIAGLGQPAVSRVEDG